MDEMTINVQQNGTVELLINNMVLEDLVVEGLGSALGDRHFECCVGWCSRLQGQPSLGVTEGRGGFDKRLNRGIIDWRRADGRQVAQTRLRKIGSEPGLLLAGLGVARIKINKREQPDRAIKGKKVFAERLERCV